MQRITNKPLFDLGRLVATAGALAALEKTGQNAVEFLARHVTGDWGELPVEDKAENHLSLQQGFRLLSIYRTSAGDKLWVITEADRSATTLLLRNIVIFPDRFYAILPCSMPHPQIQVLSAKYSSLVVAFGERICNR